MNLLFYFGIIPVNVSAHKNNISVVASDKLPVVGLFLVRACCWDSALLSVMPPPASVPTMGTRSLVSEDLLGSSTCVVACTRGGRPRGSAAGEAAAALEVRVTGTTATGALGASAAATGDSGLTSEAKASEEAASRGAGAEAWGWSAAED